MVQGAVFWRGMGAIRRFIDWAGPAVYVVMIVLCVYLVTKAGWSHLSLNLSSGPGLDPLHTFYTTLNSTALVVAYFAGPMLNFGDFARYGKSFKAVKRGNLFGLPVNYLFFSLLTVITASATIPVYHKLITDPIQTVQQISTAFAIVLGGLTFVIATVGINIVANFISPAFDFSNVKPQKISWRMGGMIAAVGSVLLTPWNWYDNAHAIDYTLGLLGALIGPLFGVLIAGYYLVSKQRVWVDDLSPGRPPGGTGSGTAGTPTRSGRCSSAACPPSPQCSSRPRGPRSASAGSPTTPGSSAAGSVSSPSGTWSGSRPIITDLDRDMDTCRDGTSEAVMSGAESGAAVGEQEADARAGMTLIQVINPNTSRAMTDGIARTAREAAGPGCHGARGDLADGARLDRVALRRGPGGARGARRRAVGELAGADGHVIACFGDPGLAAAREIADGPVVGIAEAAMHAATFLGRSFSVVTTLSRTTGRAWDLARRYGFAAACAGVHACDIPVLDLDSPSAAGAVAKACAAARDTDRCDVIVLGCAGMSGLAAELTAELGLPVVDGVAAGGDDGSGAGRARPAHLQARRVRRPPAKPVLGPLSGLAVTDG